MRGRIAQVSNFLLRDNKTHLVSRHLVVCVGTMGLERRTTIVTHNHFTDESSSPFSISNTLPLNHTHTHFTIKHQFLRFAIKRGVGGTVASQSALRSAGTLLSRVRAPLAPPPWPDGEPESLRSPCCELAICKKPKLAIQLSTTSFRNSLNSASYSFPFHPLLFSPLTYSL
ncbi:hypothetical protein PoB_003177900 [Plakobranchus ocellatus]|uniref:Uncharacterized protein n=1 Tax=Plakobranchus ocellatus TaxID=259542 RepID=A0AAV4AFR5_9GAST|nr:hypothetical protein PoB_003177900 [Plakobranchus ocellatus]